MTLTQGNTIDFDSARLKLSESAAPVAIAAAEARQPSLRTVQDDLTRKLQTTLELDRILEIFFQELRGFLGLDCLEYRLEGEAVHHRIGQPGLHRCSYRMTHAGSFLGEVQFSRRKRFNEAQLMALETLLGNLLYPLRNALLYREAVFCAHSDSLTGVGNRLAMDRALEREVKLSIRNRTCLSLLALFSRGLGTALFYTMIRRRGPLFAGMVSYLIPMIVLAWSWLDHEQITLKQVIAVVGALATVAVVQKDLEREAVPTPGA